MALYFRDTSRVSLSALKSYQPTIRFGDVVCSCTEVVVNVYYVKQRVQKVSTEMDNKWKLVRLVGVNVSTLTILFNPFLNALKRLFKTYRSNSTAISVITYLISLFISSMYTSVANKYRNIKCTSVRIPIKLLYRYQINFKI